MIENLPVMMENSWYFENDSVIKLLRILQTMLIFYFPSLDLWYRNGLHSSRQEGFSN